MTGMALVCASAMVVILKSSQRHKLTVSYHQRLSNLSLDLEFSTPLRGLGFSNPFSDMESSDPLSDQGFSNLPDDMEFPNPLPGLEFSNLPSDLESKLRLLLNAPDLFAKELLFENLSNPPPPPPPPPNRFLVVGL
jgi:hypothetical protein